MRRKLPEAPAPIPGTRYPYENYFVRGPNPAPGLQTAAYENPYRSHAPIAAPIPEYVQQDASNTTVQRVPALVAPIPVKEIAPIPVYAPSRFIGTPALTYQRGWEQPFVPEMGQRPALQATSPFLQLSQPIKDDLKQAIAASSAKRQPLKAKAPKHHDK